MLHVFNKLHKRMDAGSVTYMTAWERKYRQYTQRQLIVQKRHG